ncbi:MAG: hypothetical protein EBU66_15490 [Bacteroidetes bacterium]|nr:hypothetical protein [bacterium]NBP66051.1 hypothetical protein [Bacteroidota bacterium]
MTNPRVPPGYKNVIIKGKTGKVFATGIDKKGRKQVIYNKWFIEKQQKALFRKIMSLKPIFQKIVTDVNSILSKSTVEHFKTTECIKQMQIALIIKLMILCNFRIGSKKYLKLYGTYGVTTILWKFITFGTDKKTLHIKFIGKKHVINEAVCNDRKLYKLLFYLKKHNKANNKDSIFNVSAREINKYIGLYHTNLTAKDIRTWRANMLFIKYYNSAPKELNKKKKINYALKNVATKLHNTAAVCKSNYIHPSLVK